MNDGEFRCIEVLKLKYRRGYQIIETFYKIGSPLKIFKIEIQKLGPCKIGFSLICRNFKTLRELTTESYKTHGKLINGAEFGSGKLLKLRYRRGDQIIETFCKIGAPQKLGPPSLICRNFRTLRKVFLIHAEWTEI